MSEEAPSKKKVFLVHGRDDAATEAVRELLRAFDLIVVDWNAAANHAGGGAPYTGDVVVAGMKLAHTVVVLLTPDDIGYLRPDLRRDRDGVDELQPTGQPRLNVVFEAGMAMERARDRVVIVEVGAVRRISDIDGVQVIRLDDSVNRRRDFGFRLQNTGLEVDWRTYDWHAAGTFTRSAPADEDPRVPPTPTKAPSASAPRTAARADIRRDRSDLYKAFWERFLGRVGSERPGWSLNKIQTGRNWLVVESQPGARYVVGFVSGARLRAEFYIDRGDQEANKARLRSIEAHRAEIEASFGGALSWEELPDKRASRIAAYTDGEITRVDSHDEYANWFLATMDRLRQALAPYVE